MLIGQNKLKSISLRDKETGELLFFANDDDIQFLQDRYTCTVEPFPVPDMINSTVRVHDLLQDQDGLVLMVIYADDLFFIACPIDVETMQFKEAPYRTYLNNKKIKTLKAMGLSRYRE